MNLIWEKEYRNPKSLNDQVPEFHFHAIVLKYELFDIYNDTYQIPDYTSP